MGTICGKLNIHSHEWTVILADPLEYPDLEGKDGITLVNRNTILINVNTPILRRSACLMHEIMHAIADIYGIYNLISISLKNKDLAAEDLEEIIVFNYSSAIFDVLTRNNMLSNTSSIFKQLNKVRKTV